MAKYDVCWVETSRQWVVDVQANILDHLKTRIVVPLIENERVTEPRMNPVLIVDGKTLTLAPAYTTSVLCTELGAPIANMSSEHDKIVVALDFVFQGF